MLWVNNLGEAAVSNRRGLSRKNINPSSNSQTGPGGIDRNPKVIITPAKNLKTKVDPKNNPNDKNKNKDPAIVFAEHVTIAGLEEAFKAEFPADRYMFRVALFLALIMIIFQSNAIVSQYQNMNTISTDMFVDKTAPFPNISICFPFTFNDTTLVQQLKNVATDKDVKFMNRHHINFEKDGLDFYKSIITLTVNVSSLSSPIYLLMTKLYEKAQQKAVEEKKNLYLQLLPSCSSYLSNCVFNRITFDCCSKAKYLSVGPQSCYQIDLSNFTNMEKTETSSSVDPVRLNESGLSVDVNNNWNFGLWDKDGSASDGFYIFVDKIPTQAGDPTIIPADMDATIILNQPVAVKEKSQCRANEEKSNLKMFDYYDSYGVRCGTEAFVSLILDNLGCQFPIHSHILPDACGLRQLAIFSLVASQALDEMKQSQDGTQLMTNVSKKSDDNFKSGSSGVADNNLCLWLCSRWSYKILSASYGAIKYQPPLEEGVKVSNQSWSRIRFVMPWTSSMQHKEEWVAKGYLTMCKIGGTMSAIAGFSMITFVQLFAYGVYWAVKRKRKENPVQNTNNNQKQNTAVMKRKRRNVVHPIGEAK